jgi:CBS domain containing-hemolysin-like protein
MENNDSSEPPSRKKGLQGISLAIKNFLKIFSRQKTAAELSPDQRDALIEKSIEEFSSHVSTDDIVLEETAKEMIYGVVEISERAVKEIMVPRVDIEGVELGTPLKEVIELVKKTGHSRFPFYKESLDDIKGILYIKDIFVDGLTSGDVLVDTKTRPAFFVPENKKVSEMLKEMKRRKVHLAIVVDEYGGTAGLVTLEDILEEIVGEIEDEYDKEAPPVKKIDDKHYSVKGGLPIHELNEELDLELPEDQFETVGGVIYDIVGSLPKQGITVDYKGLKFTADRVEGQRITRVIIELPSDMISQE